MNILLCSSPQSQCLALGLGSLSKQLYYYNNFTDNSNSIAEVNIIPFREVIQGLIIAYVQCVSHLYVHVQCMHFHALIEGQSAINEARRPGSYYGLQSRSHH